MKDGPEEHEEYTTTPVSRPQNTSRFLPLYWTGGGQRGRRKLNC